MISVIICSRKSNIDYYLKSNIENTIGCKHEIIWIDNSDNKFSIFEAYNMGIKKAQYNILCFMHEDIYFHSKGWGNICKNEFDNNIDVGMLGIIGTYYISELATSWFHSSQLTCGEIIQGEYNNGKYITKKISYPAKNSINNVCAIDGLWMCIKKDLFTEHNIHFNEKDYRGFHFYDMDISMQVILTGFKISIPNNIHIEHKSIGIPNDIYYDNCLIFHSKYHNYLPLYTNPYIDKISYKEYNLERVKTLCQKCKQNYIYNKMLNFFPYKLTTKILKLFKIL